MLKNTLKIIVSMIMCVLSFTFNIDYEFMFTLIQPKNWRSLRPPGPLSDYIPAYVIVQKK